jgi:hypothetical protein
MLTTHLHHRMPSWPVEWQRYLYPYCVNDAVACSEDMAFICRVIIELGRYDRKWSWANVMLPYYHGICLTGLRKTIKSSVSGPLHFGAESWTRRLIINEREWYTHSAAASGGINVNKRRLANWRSVRGKSWCRIHYQIKSFKQCFGEQPTYMAKATHGNPSNFLSRTDGIWGLRSPGMLGRVG